MFEPLIGDNQYFCERCNAKVDALRCVSYRKLPDVLILCLLRFQFDKVKVCLNVMIFIHCQRCRIKSLNEFICPLVLDFYPYTEEALQKKPIPETIEEIFQAQIANIPKEPGLIALSWSHNHFHRITK